MSKLIDQLGTFALDLSKKHIPWTNVYGLARSFLALGTLLTLLFNPTINIFRPASGISEFPICQSVGSIGIFCAFNPYLEIARWIAIFILLLVISGWRPRITGILHWWVAFSLQTSGMVLDGGDQATAVLALLILPVTLLDSRKSHWQKIENTEETSNFNYVKALIAITCLTAARLQVSIIYFHAAVAKFALEEWLDGTILYYWLSDPLIGLPQWLQFTLPIYSSRLVAVFTWGTLLLETLLFMALLMPKKYWKPLLIAGIAFHAGIALMMGLISFGCAMTAALILYLRPFDEEFSFSFLRKLIPLKTGIKKEQINILPEPIALSENKGIA